MKHLIIVGCLLTGLFGNSFGQTFSSYQSIKQYQRLKCDSAMTTLDTENCLLVVFNDLDKEFNLIYQKIMKSFDVNDPKQLTEKTALIESEKAWLKYFVLTTDLVYKKFSDGKMRNVFLLSKKIELMQDRMTDLKNIYLNVFDGDIKARNLLGKWKLTNGENIIYEFTESNGQFIIDEYKNGIKSITANYKIDNTTLIIYDKNKPNIKTEWIYIENSRATGLVNKTSLYLYFLHGGGTPSEIFEKILD